MHKELLLLLLSIVVLQNTWCQNTYTTQQNRTYLIQNDFSYKYTSRAVGNNQFQSDINQETYILPKQELDAIIYLERSADQKEIEAYTALLKAVAQLNAEKKQSAQAEKEQKIERIEQQLKLAKNLGETVSKLRTVNKKERKKCYVQIDRLIRQLNTFVEESSSTLQFSFYQKHSIDFSNPYMSDEGSNCNLIYNDYDENLRANRMETGSQYFFGHTHPRLRRHFKEGDYLEAEASLAKIDGDYYLMLAINIASKSASKNYGALSPKERARFRFVDGNSIYLRPLYVQNGDLQNYTGHTIYKPIFKLSKDDFKLLEKVEIDDVGLMWTSGFESYEVYHVDVLQKLAKCLKK